MNAENLNLRRFLSSDLEKMIEIEMSSFPDLWPESRVKQLYQRYPNDFLIAELGKEAKEVVGYILGYEKQDGTGFIKTLAVAPDFRLQGIGTKLLNSAINRLKKEGTKKIFLTARTRNNGAVSFYKTLDFEIVKTIENYYKNGDDAFLMEKEV